MAFITQVLLPKRDNLGRVVDREKFEEFHARLILKFGGWTRKGQAEGAWLSPSGTVFADEHWIYENWVCPPGATLLARRKRAAQRGLRPRGNLDYSI
jgi:hypothetical protein